MSCCATAGGSSPPCDARIGGWLSDAATTAAAATAAVAAAAAAAEAAALRALAAAYSTVVAAEEAAEEAAVAADDGAAREEEEQQPEATADVRETELAPVVATTGSGAAASGGGVEGGCGSALEAELAGAAVEDNKAGVPSVGGTGSGSTVCDDASAAGGIGGERGALSDMRPPSSLLLSCELLTLLMRRFTEGGVFWYRLSLPLPPPLPGVPLATVFPTPAELSPPELLCDSTPGGDGGGVAGKGGSALHVSLSRGSAGGDGGGVGVGVAGVAACFEGAVSAASAEDGWRTGCVCVVRKPPAWLSSR